MNQYLLLENVKANKKQINNDHLVTAGIESKIIQE